MDEGVEVVPGVKARGISLEDLEDAWASKEPYRIPQDQGEEILREAAEERCVVDPAFAAYLFQAPVSTHSMAVTQACRLFQYFLFTDDPERKPSAKKLIREEKSLGKVRYEAVDAFVREHYESGAAKPQAAEAYGSELQPHFPGLSLSRLGFLCHMAWLFCGSASMMLHLLGRKVTIPGNEEGTTKEVNLILSDEVGEYLRMRHGRGYLSTEALAGDLEGYFENKNLTRMEAQHEAVMTRIGELIEDLWMTKSIHPLAFLARLEDLQSYVTETLAPLRGATGELGGYVLTGKEANITKAVDGRVRLAYLRLALPDKWTLGELADIVKPETANSVRCGNRYWEDFRKFAWYADFTSSAPHHANGLAELVSVPEGFRAYLMGLREVEIILAADKKPT